LNKILLVALGGAIGSSFRYLLAAAIPRIIGKIFLWGTFSVNVIGSILIGILWAYFENEATSFNLKLFLVVGILGGFTTFSSFALESINLFKSQDVRMALFYIFATNIFGLFGAIGGYYLSKEILTMLY
jgi:CrcB protein